jgi:UDP-N-acetyl-D-glucosamine/UDP-N-acetyl-D-galactosamine dehydrogenase
MDLSIHFPRQLQDSPATWLVTGAAGFIGSHIMQQLLVSGQHVVALDNFSTGHQSNVDDVIARVGETAAARLRFIKGDIRSADVCRRAVKGVDYVLHQAALGSVPRSLEDPALTNEVNVDGFLNMLIAARDEGVKRFVYAASSSTYGDHPGLPKVEDIIGKPLSPYAVTKYVDELYADVFSQAYGMEVIGLRYFNVFGPRQDPEGAYAAVIPRWFNDCMQGRPCQINGDGETSRDFCYVDNVVQANLLAATTQNPEAVNQVYNIAFGGRTTLNELYHYIRDLVAAAQPQQELPKPVYGDFRAGDVRHSQADINKAMRLLGYAPTCDVGTGLAQTSAWFASQSAPTGERQELETIAIVGLGYVGLPLAVAFGGQRRTIGFDLNKTKLDLYRAGIDPTGEVGSEKLATAKLLEFTSDPTLLSQASIIIIVVPTPIDQARRPDLSPLEGASLTVGKHLSPGTIVIYESTVYPGCTEEVCVPILEKASGMRWAGRAGDTPAAGDAREGFYIGYSPERINPGDTVHRLETITKVVSGDTPETLERVAQLYESVVTAGVHRASSVKVAEAAKVIENTQRDLNIALMNELALIFNRLGIDTLDVLEAAGTKWNFLPFRPGLVGGHCIGVDPYYLTYKAESVGYHPQVVLGGRQTNDSMSKFLAEQTVKQLVRSGHPVAGARITVLGLTFKENCPDLRNSKVADVVNELREYCCEVSVHDPLADAHEASEEYGIDLVAWDDLAPAHAVVLAVPHAAYLAQGINLVQPLVATDGVVIDVKGVLDRQQAAAAGINLWRL